MQEIDLIAALGKQDLEEEWPRIWDLSSKLIEALDAELSRMRQDRGMSFNSIICMLAVFVSRLLRGVPEPDLAKALFLAYLEPGFSSENTRSMSEVPQ